MKKGLKLEVLSVPREQLFVVGSIALMKKGLKPNTCYAGNRLCSLLEVLP